MAKLLLYSSYDHQVRTAQFIGLTTATESPQHESSFTPTFVGYVGYYPADDTHLDDFNKTTLKSCRIPAP